MIQVPHKMLGDPSTSDHGQRLTDTCDPGFEP
jgi:hypothetical protein